MKRSEMSWVYVSFSDAVSCHDCSVGNKGVKDRV
jgi:hypothetical protein